ncbi:hypothetical protein JOC45_001764 [Gordonia hydrophobica]|nr:hypothetical protein [Gordonia hydrophobica]
MAPSTGPGRRCTNHAGTVLTETATDPPAVTKAIPSAGHQRTRPSPLRWSSAACERSEQAAYRDCRGIWLVPRGLAPAIVRWRRQRGQGGADAPVCVEPHHFRFPHLVATECGKRKWCGSTRSGAARGGIGWGTSVSCGDSRYAAGSLRWRAALDQRGSGTSLPSRAALDHRGSGTSIVGRTDEGQSSGFRPFSCRGQYSRVVDSPRWSSAACERSEHAVYRDCRGIWLVPRGFALGSCGDFRRSATAPHVAGVSVARVNGAREALAHQFVSSRTTFGSRTWSRLSAASASGAVRREVVRHDAESGEWVSALVAVISIRRRLAALAGGTRSAWEGQLAALAGGTRSAWKRHLAALAGGTRSAWKRHLAALAGGTRSAWERQLGARRWGRGVRVQTTIEAASHKCETASIVGRTDERQSSGFPPFS